MQTQELWKSQKQSFKQSLEYMRGRMEGRIKSIKTPWSKFNDATTDGIEWNSLTVIGGRPGAGKTLIKDQIIREAFTKNPDEDFRVLEFQFEMLGRTSAIREYSSVLGRSYKYLCSADGKLSDEDLAKCYEYAKLRVGYPIDIVEDPITVNEFKEQITLYMKKHIVDTDEGAVYKKCIVTLDHSLLLKKAPFEKDKYDTLYNLGEAITELKRKYPIAFIILSQLNRNIDTPERNEDGKYGNYILESDIFGSDALLQHADTLIGLNRPGKQKIRFYGPDRYVIENDKVLVMHFLKCRNGDNRMSFFKAEFEKMRVLEMETPAQQERRMK
jgi:replicative DNA helicase